MRDRLRSFKHAFQGVALLFRETPNARIHLLAAALVLAAGYYKGLSPWEWALCVICIAMVLAAEAFNSALEYLTDLVSPEYHELAKKTKDVAAAAVLITAAGAAIVGGLVFLT